MKQKIEKEMRAGRKFYQMDENEDIAWFSLIGSNKAFNVLITYLYFFTIFFK